MAATQAALQAQEQRTADNAAETDRCKKRLQVWPCLQNCLHGTNRTPEVATYASGFGGIGLDSYVNACILPACLGLQPLF